MHASRCRHPTQDEGRPFEAPGLRGGSEKFAMFFALDSSWLAQVSSAIIACVSLGSLCREKLSASNRLKSRLPVWVPSALTWSSPFVTGRFSRRLADAGSAIFAPRGRAAHAVAPFKARHHRANARSWLVRPAWPSGNDVAVCMLKKSEAGATRADIAAAAGVGESGGAGSIPGLRRG